MRNIFWVVLAIFFLDKVQAQSQPKPLPDFLVKKGVKKSNIISWINHYGDACVQLTIQRSSDSLKNFRTIFSPETPSLPENGYTDKTPPEGKIFYRISYLLSGGAYYSTVSKQPLESGNVIASAQPDTAAKKAEMILTNPVANKNVVVRLLNPTKTGSVLINLPNEDLFDYSMNIYQLDNPEKVLFSINRFPDNSITLDKGAFLESGTYNYEIFKKGKSIEQGRFLIAK